LAQTPPPEPVLLVSETFYSLQGESSFAGYPCFFIRLSGCNLSCTWCDTTYAHQEPGRRQPLSRLLELASVYPAAMVAITGGEPLLQENLYPLVDQLLAAGRRVLLETNGSLSLDRLPTEIVRIMDVKCPDSRMHDRMHLDNFQYLTPHDEVKFVINSRQDYLWARDMITTFGLPARAKVIMTPVAGRFSAAELAGWVLADQLPVRLQLQLHRQLWPDKNRGA
jgi:7-carboxy-7-deazaguanine synthase